MASVARLGTPDLSTEQAKMVALKAIADAISVAAVYLGPPIQMSVVTTAGVLGVPAEEIEGGLKRLGRRVEGAPARDARPARAAGPDGEEAAG
jgi:hypothetical protein